MKQVGQGRVGRLSQYAHYGLGFILGELTLTAKKNCSNLLIALHKLLS